MPQPRQKSYVNEGETDLQKQVRLGPEAKLQALPASFLSKMSIANPRHREKKNIACPVSNRDVVTGTTRPCMPSKALLIGCKYGINRNCCSFQPVRLRGCGYGRIQSEFGVPRGGTAWRARGPPMMAAIETGVRDAVSGNSFPAPSSTRAQPSHGGTFRTCWPLQGFLLTLTPGNMFVVFRTSCPARNW